MFRLKKITAISLFLRTVELRIHIEEHRQKPRGDLVFEAGQDLPNARQPMDELRLAVWT